MKESLLKSKLTHKQLALTLYIVLKDPNVAAIIDIAGMSKPSISREYLFW